MTKQELLNLAHAKVVITPAFIHVEMDKGYHFTEYKDEEPIEKFYSSTVMYTPVHETYPDYRVITDKVNAVYAKRYEEWQKEQMEKEANKR